MEVGEDVVRLFLREKTGFSFVGAEIGKVEPLKEACELAYTRSHQAGAESEDSLSSSPKMSGRQ